MIAQHGEAPASHRLSGILEEDEQPPLTGRAQNHTQSSSRGVADLAGRQPTFPSLRPWRHISGWHLHQHRLLKELHMVGGEERKQRAREYRKLSAKSNVKKQALGRTQSHFPAHVISHPASEAAGAQALARGTDRGQSQSHARPAVPSCLLFFSS